MQHVQPTMQQIYAKIRETPEVLSGLMHISDSQELAERLSAIAHANGRTDLTPQTMATLIDEDPSVLLSAVIDNEDLTDDELELVVAGAPVVMTYGSAS